jgi:hypothetical protein
MKRTISTKRVFAKFAMLSVLLIALPLIVYGIVSAQGTAKAQSAVAACGYVQLSNWTWDQNNEGKVNIIKWQYTCGGQVHCEAIDLTFFGGLDGGGIKLGLFAYDSGTIVTYTISSRVPFREHDILNTSTIDGGYDSYECTPFLDQT